jgi:hypothetical protein
VSPAAESSLPPAAALSGGNLRTAGGSDPDRDRAGRRRPRSAPSRRRIAAVLALGLPFLAAGAPAHEIDQYSIRDVDLTDSIDVLNDEFNRVLRRIAEDWWRGEDRALFAKRVFQTMGGIQVIDKYERWARRSPEIEILRTPRDESIYRGGPFWSTRVVFFFGLGPVIRLDDQLVGTDKIGHFLSQGWKYHKRHLRGVSDEEVVSIGQRNEAGIFGFWTTGVFSNADLVANYEGYLFYRSLFEDDIIPGKPAIIEWLGSGARVQRPFDWRDHVNAYWDEALNPGLYDGLLEGRVVSHLGELCGAYEERPGDFVTGDDEELAERYQVLRLRDASRFRLDHICAERTATLAETTAHTATNR